MKPGESDPVRDAHEAWAALEAQPRTRSPMHWPGAIFGFLVLVIAVPLAVIPEQAEGGPRDRNRTERCRQGCGTAFFEFAPASGTGMGSACACTTPTGAKGEVLTFTRASSGTCLKGGTVTGIANGDLVTCSTNQPRVMPGGDGTGGSGLLVEGPRTNSVLRSQEFDNVAWVKANSGAAAPTVTADQAVAPDGTTTAERVQFPSTTGVQYSVVDQGAGTFDYSGALFVKGNASSGTIELDCNNGADHCVTCAFVAGSWTRCSCVSGGSGASLFIFGSYGAGCGSGSRSAIDVFVWGAQVEAGTFPSSYIATTSAAVTRALETASIAISPAMNASTGSHAATLVPEWSTGATATPYILIYDSSGRALYKNAGDGINFYDGTNDVTNATTWTAGTAKRVWSSYAGTTSLVNDGTDTTSGAFDGTFGSAALSTLSIGQGLGSYSFGVVKQVCADPSATRCR